MNDKFTSSIDVRWTKTLIASGGGSCPPPPGSATGLSVFAQEHLWNDLCPVGGETFVSVATSLGTVQLWSLHGSVSWIFWWYSSSERTVLEGCTPHHNHRSAYKMKFFVSVEFNHCIVCWFYVENRILVHMTDNFFWWLYSLRRF